MIYKFGTSYIGAGTVMSIALVLNDCQFLGFLMGALTLLPFLRDNK